MTVQSVPLSSLQARQTSEPTDAQRKALSYLPEPMLFPAIDPDAAAGQPDGDGPPFDADDDDDDGDDNDVA